MSLQAAGREWMWRNPDYLDAELAFTSPRGSWPDGSGGMSTWANVGGAKTWPAPQGWDGDQQWAGPPDRILDSGAYTLTFRTVDGAGLVTLTSPANDRTGLRIERRFAVPDEGTSFRQTDTFTNVSDRPVCWAIWEIVQVETGPNIGSCRVEIRGPATRLIDLGTHRGDLTTIRTADGIVVPVQDVVAKRGFPDADGFVTYRDARGAACASRSFPTLRRPTLAAAHESSWDAGAAQP